MQFIGNLSNNTKPEQEWKNGHGYWLAEKVAKPQKDLAADIASRVAAIYNERFPNKIYDSDEIEINLTKEGGASISFPDYRDDGKLMRGMILGAGMALRKNPTLRERIKNSWGWGDSHEAGKIGKQCVEFASLTDLAHVINALPLAKNQELSR